MLGHKNDPEVVAALSEGIEVFESRVVARLLREESSRLYINRCEKCGRIVVTPRACICGWCSHSWFERREQQDAIADSYLPNALTSNKSIEGKG